MRATYSASTLGMHHMSFCQGLRWFSAKRRRTVSRERLSWSVSLGGFEVIFNEAAHGPVNGRAAGSHSSGNIFVAESAVGREQNLGSFDLAGVFIRSPRESRGPDESG